MEEAEQIAAAPLLSLDICRRGRKEGRRGRREGGPRAEDNKPDYTECHLCQSARLKAAD